MAGLVTLIQRINDRYNKVIKNIWTTDLTDPFLYYLFYLNLKEMLLEYIEFRDFRKKIVQNLLTSIRSSK